MLVRAGDCRGTQGDHGNRVRLRYLDRAPTDVDQEVAALRTTRERHRGTPAEPVA
ncbi:hypothetical protein ABT354_02485 [Streptomyces sp. NPDC000594]|uniref:hypothetical protein n=1 Tax=Streptomyces sp. NPDC000594 TaxID=3154261 RepID=UPI00332403CB